MITIDLKIKEKLDHVHIKDDVLFNAILSEHPTLIKKLIRSIDPFYKISRNFFEIVNNYVDFKSDGTSMYAGLIVRTGLTKYAVLYLGGSEIDEEYMIYLIDEYIHDLGDYIPKTVDIDRFEIDNKDFIAAIKKVS